MMRAQAIRNRIVAAFRDSAGATVVETAFVAPVLVTMALGGYDVSRMIARQHELQNAIGDAEVIVMAASSGTQTTPNSIKSALMNTLGLTSSQIAVTPVYRCGVTTTTVTSDSQCSVGTDVSTYVQITLRDKYTPIWTKFGMGGPINYQVVRTVQVSQSTKTS